MTSTVPQYFSLPPPVEQSFASLQDLKTYCRIHSKAHGYAIVIDASRCNKVYFICDRGGTYRNRLKHTDSSRVRKTATKKIGCPFRCEATRDSETGTWKLDLVNTQHTHEASETPTAHPIHRRLNSLEKQQVLSMANKTIAPREIVATLTENGTMTTSKTIHNLINSSKKERLGGRTAVQALLDDLKNKGYSYDYKIDELGHLSHLFFAHPLSIELARFYSETAVIDCTYKSNRYKMPLLDVVSSTATNHTFAICHAFTAAEHEGDYMWMVQCIRRFVYNDHFPKVIVVDRELALINALKTAFPESAIIVCIWHIQQKVLAKCKEVHLTDEVKDEFMRSWNSVVEAPSEQLFYSGLCNLETNFNVSAKEVVMYVLNHWLPYKENFVHAWTDKYLHLGELASSRSEGAHYTIKSWIKTSTGDLQVVVDRIELALEKQHRDICNALAIERQSTYHIYNTKLYSHLVRKVSKYALALIHEQYNLAIRPLQPTANGTIVSLADQCTGVFTTTFGLPCWHTIRQFHLTEQQQPANRLGTYRQPICSLPLNINQIHRHWHTKVPLPLHFGEQAPQPSVHERTTFPAIIEQLTACYDDAPAHMQAATEKQLTEIIIAGATSHVLNPLQVVGKGRPKGAKNKKSASSTGRDPSGFELVPGGIAAPTRRCGCCQQFAHHNARSCPMRPPPSTAP